MDKALIIIPDSNKGKFIAKGFASAFRSLSYFVIEKKIYDLNFSEINKISPAIIFVCWTGILNQQNVVDFIGEYSKKETFFIHCSEYTNEIPKELKKKENHFIFTSDSKSKKNRFMHSIEAQDYKTKFSGYRYNITFAGNPAKTNREKILAKLIYNYGPINIYCRSYDFYKSVEDIEKAKLLDEYFLELYKQSYKGYVDSKKELAEIYSSTKINIDIADEHNKFINYRILEVLAANGFLISEYNIENVKYLDDGKDFETFKTEDELIDKIKFYMKNLNIAQMISMRGRRNVVSNFSYTDRLKKMLKVIYGKDISSR